MIILVYVLNEGNVLKYNSKALEHEPMYVEKEGEETPPKNFDLDDCYLVLEAWPWAWTTVSDNRLKVDKFTFLPWWPWPLTYDIDLWTCMRHDGVKHVCQGPMVQEWQCKYSGQKKNLVNSLVNSPECAGPYGPNWSNRWFSILLSDPLLVASRE